MFADNVRRFVLTFAVLFAAIVALVMHGIGHAGSIPVDIRQDVSPPTAPNQADRLPEFTVAQTMQGEMSISEVETGVTPLQIAAALGVRASDIVSASIMGSDPAGVGIANQPLGNYFPTEGSTFALLSTGSVASADLPNTSASTSAVLSGTNNSQGNDLAQLYLSLQVPAGMNCASFDFAFLSEEFPEFVGSRFNDTFTAEIGGTSLTISETKVVAPLNFAFDTQENVISVNTVFGVTADTASTFDGETSLLRARTPVTPSTTVDFVFSVQDLGDSIYDSAVFIDKFFWSNDSNCNPGAQEDVDGDGLLTVWETVGLTVTVNGSDVFVDLPAMGADPRKKDVFVEIDYMVEPGVCVAGICKFGHSHQPQANAIAPIVTAFANAPVPNPDGTTGIVLHVDFGADTVMDPVTGQTWGALSQSNSLAHVNQLGSSNTVGTSTFYQWNAFDAIRNDNFSPARAAVFHYAVFAHNLGGFGATSGMSRSTNASDFIVSLGSWTNQVGTANDQAGTFMHELGHNLGLRHSGEEDSNDTNFKPNYLSIMNYAFQTTGLIINGEEGHFDYSRFAIPPLDENQLNESVGLNGGQAVATYGTRYWCSMDKQMLTMTSLAIDWNCDSDTQDSSVAENINEGPNWRHDEILGELRSYNDWANLVFTGGAIGQPGANPTLPTETLLQEITQEEDATLVSFREVAISGLGSAAATLGSTVDANITISNRGTLSDTYVLTATSSLGWSDIASVPATINLEPGASAVLPLVVTVPNDATPGIFEELELSAVSSVNPLVRDTAAAKITAESGPLATLHVSGSPLTLVANGTSTATITATLINVLDSPVVGISVTFTTSKGSILSPITTDAAGTAIALLTADTIAGTGAVSVTVAGLGEGIIVSFVAGPPGTLTVTAESSTLIADGSGATTVRARVQDAFGNLVPGQQVTFKTQLGEIVGEATTDVTGVAQVTLTAGTKAGKATITATAGNVAATTDVTFTPGAPAKLAITGGAATLPPDGVSSTSITVQVNDAFDNPIPGQTVAFATTLGSITPTALTDATGVAAATLTSAQAVGTAKITASLGALAATKDVVLAGNALSGVIFADLNESGKQDNDEPGIAGVTVEATLQALAADAEAGAAALVGTSWRTTSAADGSYVIADLPHGDYVVAILPVASFNLTTAATFNVTVGPAGVTAPSSGALARTLLPLLLKR